MDNVNNEEVSNAVAIVPEPSKSFVYLLESTSGATYVGATVDLTRRLRQHNKELVGGAHATSAKVAKGETWRRVCHVAGFPDWTAALQFEWRWKQLSRKLPKQLKPLERRSTALKQLLALKQPTTKAVPYSAWSIPPQVNVEIDCDLFAHF
jgi:predicted GIY-YIG superfamily endonuclease